MTDRGRAAAWCLVVLTVAGVLYGLTLYPGVGGRVNVGDSAKFQYIGKILGVPHQPGYPQYVVLSHLWTRLPLGLELARQVNLLSVILALLAGGFLFTALRRLTARDLGATLGTTTVLLSRPVWTFATEAEVHALHLVYVSALLWAVERWRARGTTGWRLAVVGLFAAGCGNHPLMVAFIPGLLLLFGADWRATLQPRFMIAALLALCLGAGQYSYLLWRASSGAEVIEAVPRYADGSDLLLAMGGFRFASQHLETDLTPADPRLSEIGRSALLQLPLACLALVPVGAVVWWRRDRLLAGFALLTLLTGVLLILAYRIGDWRPYLGPVWLWAVTLASVGWARGTLPPTVRRACAALWLGQLALLAAESYSRLRLADNPHDRSRLIASAGPGGIVLAYAGETYRGRELARYYRLGLDLPRVTTARQALEEQWLFLGDHPLVFADRRVRAMVEAYRIDHVGRVESGPQPMTVFTTGSEWPLEALQLVPGDGGATVRRPEGHLLAEARRPLQIVVVGVQDRRVKGVVSWPLATVAQQREALAQVPRFLKLVLPGDYVCVLLQGEPRLGDQRGLREIARDVLGLPGPVEESQVAVLAGRSRDLQLHLDPPGPLMLRIEG